MSRESNLPVHINSYFHCLKHLNDFLLVTFSSGELNSK